MGSKVAGSVEFCIRGDFDENPNQLSPLPTIFDRFSI